MKLKTTEIYDHFRDTFQIHKAQSNQKSATAQQHWSKLSMAL